MNIKHIFSLTLLLATPFSFSADTKAVVSAAKSVAKPAVKVASLEIKTGYFNSAQAVSESKLGKEAYAQIEKKRLSFEEDFKKDESAYTKKIKDLQAKASTMSDSAKHSAEESLMKMKRDIENKAKGYDEDLKLAMNQAQEKIFKDLSDAVYKAGRAAGKDVMVDVASGRVYTINADKVNDTNLVVSNMDVAYNKHAQTSKKVTA